MFSTKFRPESRNEATLQGARVTGDHVLYAVVGDGRNDLVVGVLEAEGARTIWRPYDLLVIFFLHSFVDENLQGVVEVKMHQLPGAKPGTDIEKDRC